MAAVSLRLPEELSKRLDKMARKTGRTKTYYIRQAIEEKIADFEDWYLAEHRMKEHLAGRSKSYTQAEMEREFGLAD